MERAPHSYAAIAQATAAAVLICTLAIAPIPLASNRDWGWSPVCFAVGVALILQSISYALQASRVPSFPPSWSLKVALLAMTVVLSWAVIQAMAWDGASRLSSFFSTAEEALRQPTQTRDVVDPERALTGVMRLFAYAGVFWLAVQLGRIRRYANAISLTLMGSAVLVTLYGWVMELSTHSCVALHFVKMERPNGAPCPFSGTFINSSNYADFASMASLICLAYLHDHLLQRGESERSARARWRSRLRTLTGIGAFYLTALLFLLCSIVYSASRAGLAAFAVGAITMTILPRAVQRERRAGFIGATIGVLLVISIALAIGGEGVLRRSLALFTDEESARTHLFTLTVDAISIHPWAGWGLGSFEPLYSAFQPASLYLQFDKAHNTYLENALDLGIPISLTLLLAIASPAIRCARGLYERRRDTQFAAAAVGSSVLLAVHSIVDFGIQIPAIAVTYSAILGIGWAQSWRRQHLPAPNGEL